MLTVHLKGLAVGALWGQRAVQCTAAGHDVLRLNAPWRHGTTHLVMSPLEFMQRLAEAVPPPHLAMHALCADRSARVTVLRRSIWGTGRQHRVVA